MPVPLAAKGTYELQHVASLCTVSCHSSGGDPYCLRIHPSIHSFIKPPAAAAACLSRLCIVISHAVEAALAGAEPARPMNPQ